MREGNWVGDSIPGAQRADTMHRRKPIITRAIGRICAQDGCKVVLSRYNLQPMCAVHERERVFVQRANIA